MLSLIHLVLLLDLVLCTPLVGNSGDELLVQELRGRILDLDEAREGICSPIWWIPACPGICKCVPPGAICCSNLLHYAIPPEECPDGTYPISTAPLAREQVTPTPTPTPKTITSLTPVITQHWYTTEVTWYYYSYFWIIIHAASPTLTSIQITVETTLSAEATDSAQASDIFSAWSATMEFVTPVQTATITVDAPGGPLSSTASTQSSTTGAARAEGARVGPTMVSAGIVWWMAVLVVLGVLVVSL